MTNQLFQEFHQDLMVFLQQEERPFPKLMIVLERVIGRKREQIFYGLVLAVSIYLILGYGAELLCNTIGFAYPAIASFEAIETFDKDDDTHWLTYWTVFGTISLFDFIADKIMETIPIYWLAKCTFLLWLYLPYFRGAQRLHRNFFGPMYRRWRPHLHAAAAEMNQNVQNVGGGPQMGENQQPQPENAEQPAPV